MLLRLAFSCGLLMWALAAGAGTTTSGQKVVKKQEGAIGVCLLIPSGLVTLPDSAEYQLAAWSMAETYFEKFRNVRKSFDSATEQVLRQPKHGKFVEGLSYYPEPSYVGKDTISFLVENASSRVKVIFFIQVTPEGVGNESYKKLCPKPHYWKISSGSDPTTENNSAVQT